MMRSLLIAGAFALTAQSAFAAEDYKLPSSVTPAVKAACESDVRRHCVDSDPSYAKIKACVIAKFGQFGTRCKMQAALAGIRP